MSLPEFRMRILGIFDYITREGTYKSYLEKIASFPLPERVHEQRFLGTINYYRDYIPHMAEIAALLYRLKKKEIRWEWDEGCNRAFKEQRGKLISEPIVLTFPDWSETFYVESDASTSGIAAVLSQNDMNTGKLLPIRYHSSALSDSQKNYSAGQSEAWALVAAARKWAVYISGASEVVFVTDHWSLQWLRRQRDPRHTYPRWILELKGLPH